MKRILGLAIAATLAVPATASAGTYEVKACPYGSIGNGSWAAEVSSQYATAYSACPGDGIVTRMSGGSGRAPVYTGARHVFTAPPGTEVVRSGQREPERPLRLARRSVQRSDVDLVRARLHHVGHVPAGGAVDATPQLHAQVICADPDGCPRVRQDGIIAMRDVVVTVEDKAAGGRDHAVGRSRPAGGTGAIRICGLRRGIDWHPRS